MPTSIHHGPFRDPAAAVSLGGMGLSTEMAFQEGFRIARTLRIPNGTSAIQRWTIARQLLRGDATF